MTQRRHKPIVTPRRKTNGAPKKTVRWNERWDDLKTWNRRHEDNGQWLEEPFSKRISVFKATKSEYQFCPRSDAMLCCQLFPCEKSLYSHRACSVWTARGLSQLETRRQQVSPAHSGTFAKQQPGTCITLFFYLPPLHEYVMKLHFFFFSYLQSCRINFLKTSPLFEKIIRIRAMRLSIHPHIEFLILETALARTSWENAGKMAHHELVQHDAQILWQTFELNLILY